MVAQPAVYVLGCGGHAKVVVQALLALEYRVAAIFDDNPAKCEQEYCGIRIHGPINRVAEFPRLPAMIAVGDNAIRAAIAQRLDLEWLTAVHPAAFVDPTASLAEGTVVMAGAVVQADAKIGRHVIINTLASVDHDCTLGDFVHVAPGVRLAGGVSVGAGSLLGLGSIVLPERRVGSRVVVGAGAVVTRDVMEGATVVGVPACQIREGRYQT